MGPLRVRPKISASPAEILITDTAFDADAFRAHLEARGIIAVIPSNRARGQAFLSMISIACMMVWLR